MMEKISKHPVVIYSNRIDNLTESYSFSEFINLFEFALRNNLGVSSLDLLWQENEGNLSISHDDMKNYLERVTALLGILKFEPVLSN